MHCEFLTGVWKSVGLAAFSFTVYTLCMHRYLTLAAISPRHPHRNSSKHMTGLSFESFTPGFDFGKISHCLLLCFYNLPSKLLPYPLSLSGIEGLLPSYYPVTIQLLHRVLEHIAMVLNSTLCSRLSCLDVCLCFAGGHFEVRQPGRQDDQQETDRSKCSYKRVWSHSQSSLSFCLEGRSMECTVQRASNNPLLM